MLQPYLPILLLVAFVIANAVLMLAVSHVFSTYRRTPTKIAPYESGMPVLGDARERFSIARSNRFVAFSASCVSAKCGLATT